MTPAASRCRGDPLVCWLVIIAGFLLLVEYREPTDEGESAEERIRCCGADQGHDVLLSLMSAAAARAEIDLEPEGFEDVLADRLA